MSYVLAVDIGTSSTAAAIATLDHNASAVPEGLPLDRGGNAVPSVVYYPEEGPVLAGEAAERLGLEDPGRLVRGFKRRLGDPDPFVVGTLSLPAEEIFATMARWVVDRAEEREGDLPAEIVITHPASWGAPLTSAVLAALANQGLHNVTLITEPEAAVLHYASQVRVEDGSTIAVYELDGGTFDTAILRKTGEGHFELLASPGGIEGLGGADFDAAVRRDGIKDHIGATVDALGRSLESLGLEPEDLTAVLLVGGSPSIPLAAQLMSEQLGRPIVFDADPQTSICFGAAAAATRVLPAMAAEPADAADAVPGIPAPADVAVEPHDPQGRASLSSEPGAAFGSLTGTAAVGDGARGIPAGSAHHDHAHAARGGAHAPRPAVRLTAVAAGAALFTILSAAAAQSPGGLSNITAMLVPDATPSQSAPAAPGALGAAGAAAPAAVAPGAVAPGAEEPPAGIEASARPAVPAAPAAGIEAGAAPGNRPSTSAPPPNSSTPGGAVGSTPGGSGTVGGPIFVAGPGTPAVPGTAPAPAPAPAPGTTPPASTTPPGTTPPVTTPPVTTQPPVTTPPVTTQPPVTTPPATTQPPVTTPPVTTQPPVTTPPVTTQPPVPVVPAPTTVAPPPAPVVPAPTTVAPPPAPVVPAPTTVAPPPPPVIPAPPPAPAPPPVVPAPTTVAPAPAPVVPPPAPVVPAPTTVAPAPVPTTIAPAPSAAPTTAPAA
ncbi:Hsp70 family protein [Pseudarthrobacter sp. IC2-21]|uniref:Hsp70 family protein n=1 Tax=Pseudarthrobacter sp. IC2-21 TaxID=3092262 RepID=UPI002A6B70F4|nr:Hsp70 family protein [Pseudarthrobacter sp. IC2-21]